MVSLAPLDRGFVAWLVERLHLPLQPVHVVVVLVVGLAVAGARHNPVAVGNGTVEAGRVGVAATVRTTGGGAEGGVGRAGQGRGRARHNRDTQGLVVGGNGSPFGLLKKYNTL